MIAVKKKIWELEEASVGEILWELFCVRVSSKAGLA